MKCRCGGELEPINFLTYKCKICGLKFAVAIAPIPISNAAVIEQSKEYSDKINEQILNAFRIPKQLFKEGSLNKDLTEAQLKQFIKLNGALAINLVCKDK